MITPANILSPEGPVDASLFPGEASNVLEARIQKYIDATIADERVAAQTDAVKKDRLVQAYVQYKAFEAVYIRMSAEPLTLNVTEKGGHGYSYEQIRGMKALSDKYLSDFNGLLSISQDTVANQIPGTMSIKNRVEW